MLLRIFKEQTSSGHANSQFGLGKLYLQGAPQVPVNKEASLHLLQSTLSRGRADVEKPVSELVEVFFNEVKEARTSQSWEKCYCYLRLAQKGGVVASLRELDELFCKCFLNGLIIFQHK
jgi:hypothetical protein